MRDAAKESNEPLVRMLQIAQTSTLTRGKPRSSIFVTAGTSYLYCFKGTQLSLSASIIALMRLLRRRLLL